MPALTDWELWAVAARVMEAEGEHVGEFLIARIKALSEDRDHDGVSAWIAIADRVQQLANLPDDRNELH